MAGETVRLALQDGVAWLTIDRPKVNALNRETMEALDRAVANVGADPAVHGVVVTGAGDKAFVAGADIAELNELTVAQARELSRRGQEIYRRIETLGKPVIAAVNGFALGGGCELAMACHIRVASDNALFGQPEVKLGLIPGYAGTQRLPRLVGKGRALELLLSGRNVTAGEAERIGLVNKVVPQVELTQAVTAMMTSILANGPGAVAGCLEAVNHGLEMPFDDGCRLEAALFGLGAGSEEMREGTSAFLEKRPARFR